MPGLACLEGTLVDQHPIITRAFVIVGQLYRSAAIRRALLEPNGDRDMEIGYCKLVVCPLSSVHVEWNFKVIPILNASPP
jgi:hypothetical protein